MARKKTSIKVLDMDEYLGSILSNPGRSKDEDELDVILRDAARMKVRRVKMMELDKYLLQSEQELEKLMRGESLTSAGRELKDKDLLRMSRELSKLPDAERDAVIRNYALLKSTEGGSSSAPYLPLLVGFAKANPGASDNQMISYLKLMDSQLLKGMEIAKLSNPNPAGDDASALKFLGLMKDLIVDGVRNPLLAALRDSQPQPGVFEQILTKPELFSRAKEIGMFGSSGTASTNIDLEIEKLRGERQLTVTKMELEMRRDALKREAEDRRMENLLTVFAPIAGALAGTASQKMRDFGQQQAYAHNPLQNNPTPPIETAQQKNVIHLKCTCGHQEPVRFEGPTPKSLRCPACDKELFVQGTTQTEGSAGDSPDPSSSSDIRYMQSGQQGS